MALSAPVVKTETIVMPESVPTVPIHILLVEDNPGDVRLIQEAFDSIDSEVEIQVVTDGEAAVKYVQHNLLDEGDPCPDIILLDLNLPRVDGFGVLEILKNELKSPPPPVLILSSSAATGDIERSYEKGCDAYLTKPNSMSEFMSLAHSIKNFWIDAVRTPQARS